MPTTTRPPVSGRPQPAGDAWPVLAPGAVEPAAVLRRRWQVGELTRVVDDLYLPSDLVTWPVARCRALQHLLRPGWAAGLSAAVWARGGPGRSPTGAGRTDTHDLDLLAPPASALRVADGARVRLVPVAPDDVEVVHGARVTTPVRTAADLALWGTGRDDDALAWLWSRGVDPADVVDHLVARGPVPMLARAARVLRSVRTGASRPLAGVSPSDR